MACDFERNRYQTVQQQSDKYPTNAILKTQVQDALQKLNACEGRSQVTETRQAKEALASQQAAASAALAAQNAATAQMYASGAGWKDLTSTPDYQDTFDPSKFMFSKQKTSTNVGLIVGGILGGGILLIITLFFLMKKPRRPYGYKRNR